MKQRCQNAGMAETAFRITDMSEQERCTLDSCPAVAILSFITLYRITTES
jgi:hypothetical protein